jgi:hypothetical protein
LPHGRIVSAATDTTTGPSAISAVGLWIRRNNDPGAEMGTGTGSALDRAS